MEAYEAPEITELGSVAEFTEGSRGSGSSDRIFNFDIPFFS